MWENFIVSEFVKKQSYSDATKDEIFFWHSKTRSEIDLILKQNGDYYAYEIKYSSNQKVKFPNSFLGRYSPKEEHAVNRKNFFEFI